jgi:hypothetical protein
VEFTKLIKMKDEYFWNNEGNDGMRLKRIFGVCLLIPILLTGCATNSSLPVETDQVTAAPATSEAESPIPSEANESIVTINPEGSESNASPTPMNSIEPQRSSSSQESKSVSSAPSQSSVPKSTASPKPSIKASPKPSPSAAAGSSATQNTSPKGGLSSNERLMNMTFQALIQMDKAEGLTITKEQALPMVTIVQEVITKDELTAAAKTQLEAGLTADQKKFLVDNAAKALQRSEAGKGQAPQGVAPEGDSNREKLQGGPRPSGNGNAGAAGSMRNIGEELLTLLQTKV